MSPFVLKPMRSMVVGALMLTALMSRNADAQSPTPENTVITNMATVNFTDANNNTYTPVTASVSVTVGFVSGIDLNGSASATPATGSTGNSLSFAIQNLGNGTDQFSVAQSISNSGVITITGYVVNSVSHASISALNTALASTNVAQNASLTVQVVYSVSPTTGGAPTALTLTATSVRGSAATDSFLTDIAPPGVYSVAVSPDGGQNLSHLPSNGTNFSFTFAVTNNANGTDGFALAASTTGSAITILSVNGVSGSTTSISGLASGASQNIIVAYSIGNVAAGSTDNLRLTATSTLDNTKSDNGTADVTVIRAALSMSKAAYRDNQSVLIGAGDLVLPGEYIQYKVTVTNNGAAPASAVRVDDTMADEVTFVSVAGDASGWTLSQTSGVVAADLAGTLAPSAARFFWIRVQVK